MDTSNDSEYLDKIVECGNNYLFANNNAVYIINQSILKIMNITVFIMTNPKTIQ